MFGEFARWTVRTTGKKPNPLKEDRANVVVSEREKGWSESCIGIKLYRKGRKDGARGARKNEGEARVTFLGTERMTNAGHR